MEYDFLIFLLRVATFGIVFALGLWAFAAALIMGPGRKLSGSTLGFLDSDGVESDQNAKGLNARRLRRPNRADLTSPDTEKRRRALQSYRDRAKNALKQLDQIKSEAIWQSIRIVLGTLVGSTAAFALFLVANDFLFGLGDALEHYRQQPLASSVALILAKNIDAAIQLNLMSNCAADIFISDSGFAVQTASKTYRLTIAWSVPVIAQQIRWIFSGLEDKIRERKSALQAIVDTKDDEKLLEHLKPYIERRAWSVSATFSRWISAMSPIPTTFRHT